MPLDLPISAKRLEELATKYGTPLQLYDGDQIKRNAEELIAEFKKGGFADFRQHFAVKALPNPAILQLLVNAGCGLDCSSVSELHIARELGVPGSKVMYTSNYTSKADLAYAFDQGVVINLDDVSLVGAMVEVRGRCPELISFRLNPGLGRTDSETASNVLGGATAKFGVPPDQIIDGYREAKKHGSRRFGIHMMTGSCVMSQEYWSETVGVLLATMKHAREELEIDFEFVNIGGGMGIPYRPEQAPVSVPDLVEILRTTFASALAEGGALHGVAPPRLYMENGRFMTGPYGWLVARCQALKQTYGRYYGLDACMSNLMRPGMYGAYHHITVPTAVSRDAPEEVAHVVGTLCENNDWFAKDRLLPRAEVGDLFVIHDTGAHAHSMGFQYNGKLRAPEVLLRNLGQDDFCIRDRETVECLYANTHIPTDMRSQSLVT